MRLDSGWDFMGELALNKWFLERPDVIYFFMGILIIAIDAVILITLFYL